MQENNGKITKSLEQKAKEKAQKELVAFVKADFERRRKERVALERQWELNLNFLKGNQHCRIGLSGNVEKEEKEYFWQSKEVFNHISPIMETRLARLSRVHPEISVRPKSDDDEDVSKASIAEKLLSGAFKSAGLTETVRRANTWSETCGTAFYKVVWNSKSGMKTGIVDGEEVREGEVEISVVSPFEIFPDNLYAEKITDLKSIIHAKAVPVSVIRERYGVSLAGGDIDVFGLTPLNNYNSQNDERKIQDAVIVIERYDAPSLEYPKGRLITVAGDKLLYNGELPYLNGENGARTFPFVKQDSLPIAGSFFSASIVERMIPVQRAFNAVKNRKHEFLNRLCTGVLTVEDGAVDLDDLEGEGLSPGKVLVYRQGSKAPEMMDESAMPPDFDLEEEKLLNEFISISGVSEVSTASKNANLSSGSALELLVEQDNERLVMNAESIRNCYLEMARQTLRLYAQFISGLKAVSYKDAFGRTKICYADKSTALADDVYLESENELSSTPNKQKETLFRLYDSGLLFDNDGKLRPTTKEKLLSLLGYKDLDYQKGLSRLHEEKAQNENEKIREFGVEVDEIDDHGIHIDEHIRYALSEYEELSEEEKKRIFNHINTHKQIIKESAKAE
ncbi:MAG: hypothetical protein IJY57_05000 [Clostridia bacterium]|nr:hypothetical protein [Clostridia bacterium]